MKQGVNRKVIIVFLYCFLLLICSVSCGKQPENTKDEDSEVTEKTEEPIADADMMETDDNHPKPSEDQGEQDADAANTEEVAAPINHEDTDFVLVKDYVPNLYVDLKYATTDNFTGQIIYNFDAAYLRYGTVKKLAMVAEELAQDGYALKIWDAFRPVSAQFKLWEVYPDNTYVANPNYGYTSHSRGNTIDLTMVTISGDDVEMPTDFDTFSPKADRDYSDCTQAAAQNAAYLEQVMIRNGFKPYFGEWWDFSDTDYYEGEGIFDPANYAE